MAETGERTEPMPDGIHPKWPKLDPKTGVPLQRASGSSTGIADQPVPAKPEPSQPLTENGGGMMGNAEFPPVMHRMTEPTLGDRLKPETLADLKKRGGG
jgi:hypothetical protein